MQPQISAQKISVSEEGINTGSRLVPDATCGHALVVPTPFLAPLHESTFAVHLTLVRVVWSVETAYVQPVLEATSAGLFLTFSPFSS